jgi:hypothetical protein
MHELIMIRPPAGSGIDPLEQRGFEWLGKLQLHDAP